MVARGDLLENSLARYNIPVHSWRQADIAAMGVAGTAGDHFVDEATNVLLLKGNTPSSSTVTDISWLQFTMPTEYVGGGDVRFAVTISVNAASDSNTVDLSVYRQDPLLGTVGADICATDAGTVTATLQVITFVITAASLAPGDILNLKLTTVNNDADGSDGIASIFTTALLLDVKG